MATYVNDLRLKEIATGDEAGTWGTSTNTNLELIAEAFSFGTEAITTNADTHTTTIADGSTDPGRSLFLKYTGTLDSTCTITIGPNTVSKLWFIENATSGSQSIIIKQGSGATVTIANGQTKAIYSDGAGSGGAMVDAFQDLSIPDLFIDDDLTIGDDLVFSSDSAVITFGADGDTTLTHTDGSGLTLNSTNKLMFNDASQFIQGSSATVLSLGATDEIDLTATLIDINGNADVSGTVTAGGLTVDGNATISNATNPKLEISDTTLPNTLLLQSLNGDSVVGTSSNTSLALKTNNLSRIGLANNGDISFYEDTGTTPKLFWDASTERLGIGTSSPSQTLETVGSIFINAPSGNPDITIKTAGTGNNPFVAYRAGDNVVFDNMLVASAATDYWRVGYGASGSITDEHLVVTSAGNIGAGITTPDNKLHVYKGASGHSWSFDSGDAFIVENNDSVSINIATPSANSANILFSDADARGQGRIAYDHSSDYMAFYTGGVGNEHMRIDSSGNVGINTTDIGANLSVRGDASTGVINVLDVGNNQNAATTGDGARIRLHCTPDENRGVAIGNLSEANFAVNNSMVFYTSTASTLSEKMRLDSSGNLLIGSSSSSATSGEGSKFVSNGRLFQVSSYSTSAQESLAMYSTGVSAYRFYVDWGGTVHATSTSISAISDQRLKENIRDLDAGLDEVLALKPRKFDWKEGKGANTKDARGFIAQEFEEVFPDLIDEWKDPAPEGEEPYKSVRQDLIPVLVKAIQEQQAQIEALQSEINLLKGE